MSPRRSDDPWDNPRYDWEHEQRRRRLDRAALQDYYYETPLLDNDAVPFPQYCTSCTVVSPLGVSQYQDAVPEDRVLLRCPRCGAYGMGGDAGEALQDFASIENREEAYAAAMLAKENDNMPPRFRQAIHTGVAQYLTNPKAPDPTGQRAWDRGLRRRAAGALLVKDTVLDVEVGYSGPQYCPGDASELAVSVDYNAALEDRVVLRCSRCESFGIGANFPLAFRDFATPGLRDARYEARSDTYPAADPEAEEDLCVTNRTAYKVLLPGRGKKVLAPGETCILRARAVFEDTSVASAIRFMAERGQIYVVRAPPTKNSATTTLRSAAEAVARDFLGPYVPEDIQLMSGVYETRDPPPPTVAPARPDLDEEASVSTVAPCRLDLE